MNAKLLQCLIAAAAVFLLIYFGKPIPPELVEKLIDCAPPIVVE